MYKRCLYEFMHVLLDVFLWAIRTISSSVQTPKVHQSVGQLVHQSIKSNCASVHETQKGPSGPDLAKAKGQLTQASIAHMSACQLQLATLSHSAERRNAHSSGHPFDNAGLAPIPLYQGRSVGFPSNQSRPG